MKEVEAVRLEEHSLADTTTGHIAGELLATDLAHGALPVIMDAVEVACYRTDQLRCDDIVAPSLPETSVRKVAAIGQEGALLACGRTVHAPATRHIRPLVRLSADDSEVAVVEAGRDHGPISEVETRLLLTQAEYWVVRCCIAQSATA